MAKIEFFSPLSFRENVEKKPGLDIAPTLLPMVRHIDGMSKTYQKLPSDDGIHAFACIFSVHRPGT